MCVWLCAYASVCVPVCVCLLVCVCVCVCLRWCSRACWCVRAYDVWWCLVVRDCACVCVCVCARVCVRVCDCVCVVVVACGVTVCVAVAMFVFPLPKLSVRSADHYTHRIVAMQAVDLGSLTPSGTMRAAPTSRSGFAGEATCRSSPGCEERCHTWKLIIVRFSR
jgi:hypothetical protein